MMVCCHKLCQLPQQLQRQEQLLLLCAQQQTLLAAYK
jgi:hypothetical protein